MSQTPGRSSATVTLPYAAAPSTPRRQTSDALPPYLGRHIQLGFTQDDVAALISSIDSSQAPLPESAHGNPTLARLPAELLLQVLEHVPVDHVLDWRLVCRGFRDAIDGRVLYHCLQRTQLVGYVGPRDDPHMDDLEDEEYEAVHLVEADFLSIEQDAKGLEEKRPIWSGKHAVFKIKDEWYRAFRTMCGLETQPGDTLNGVAPQWLGLLDRLAMLNEELYGSLRWCIRLDHAVLDLDLPADKNRLHFDFDVNFRTGLVRVAWKDMLVRFLKTERALRILMDEKRDSRFTFSHHEDCLRSIRRTRLLSSLTTTHLDNTIRWAMRPLTPLFGIPSNRHASSPLTRIENDAITVLLLLRRTAALSPSQLSYLRTLHATYQALEASLRALDATYTEFKSYMSMPGFQTSILLPSMISNAKSVPGNPVAWSDELRVRIECQVARWKQQAGVMDKVRGLLEGSCEAMAAPEDGFDELGSDF